LSPTEYISLSSLPSLVAPLRPALARPRAGGRRETPHTAVAPVSASSRALTCVAARRAARRDVRAAVWFIPAIIAEMWVRCIRTNAPAARLQC